MIKSGRSSAGIGMLPLWLSLVFALVAPSGVRASESGGPPDSTTAESPSETTPTETRRTGFLSRSKCFPGLPGSECPWFMLSEITAGKRLRQEQGLDAAYLTAELGYMRSLGRDAAWGISASSTWSEDHRYGLHGHYRRWLNRHFSVDLSPGVWASGETMFDNRFNHLGVSARADLMWEETFGVGVEMDSGNPYGQKAGTEWKTAFRAGGYASFAAAGMLAFLGILYAIAMNDPNY